MENESMMIRSEMRNLKIEEDEDEEKEDDDSCSSKKEPDPRPNVSSSISERMNATSLLNSLTIPAGSPNDLPAAAPSLSLPLKFEDSGGDVIDMQFPDYTLWESIFSDQLLAEGDFMICSPVRSTNHHNNNMAASSNHNYHYFNTSNTASQVGGNMYRQGPVCRSPPRGFPSPLGPNKLQGRGLSPLHRVFNSPNNQLMQVDQVECLSLPALETLLQDDDDDSIDDFVGCASIWGNMPDATAAGEGSIDCYSDLTSVPTDQLLDCLMSRSMPNSAQFSGTVLASDEEASVQRSTSQVTRENNSIHHHHQSLSQQLGLERQQEQQHWQHLEKPQHQQQQLPQPRIQQVPSQQLQQLHNTHNTLMGPIPEPEEQDSGLQLVHLLLACAEAVSKEDYMSARRYLHHLNRVVSPLGDSMQRVASCFTEALTARLAATLTNKPTPSNLRPFNPFPPDDLEILKIYQILYQACPYIKFAHFTANQAIFEAFEAEERVHVIDLDILQGYQWPAFMQALAARPGGAPFLRITGVGPSPESVNETGRCLTELAHSLHVPFEFHAVGEELEDLKPHMFNRRVGEALAVNSVNRLHRVPGNCLGNLLTMIRDQAPNIVTVVEQEASHSGPYFLGRFLEALHYYSAIFDSLDATFPPDSAQRTKVEQHILAPEIRNIVAQEGPARTMRHERLEKWRKIMEAKGFQGVSLSSNAVTQSKILLGLYSCDGYRLTEDRGCLLLGWQDRSILAASAWQC